MIDKAYRNQKEKFETDKSNRKENNDSILQKQKIEEGYRTLKRNNQLEYRRRLDEARQAKYEMRQIDAEASYKPEEAY